MPKLESYEGIEPEIAESAYIHSSAVIIGKVRIAEECSIWPNTTLRGDEGRIEVGARSNIQDGSTVHMTGGLSDTIIGERVTVGHSCILHGCHIEDDCLIGMGAILLDNCIIGAGSIIGAGTLITQRKVIPPNSLVFGNPFKVVRQLSAVEQAQLQYSWRHYVEHSRIYLEHRE